MGLGSRTQCARLSGQLKAFQKAGMAVGLGVGEGYSRGPMHDRRASAPPYWLQRPCRVEHVHGVESAPGWRNLQGVEGPPGVELFARCGRSPHLVELFAGCRRSGGSKGHRLEGKEEGQALLCCTLRRARRRQGQALLWCTLKGAGSV